MDLIALPKDWNTVKVAEIAKLIRGISYSKDDASFNPSKDRLPILRANNINGDLNFEDLVYVPKSLIKPEQIIKQDDIIFAMSSGSKHLVGKTAVAKNDFNGSYGAFCALLRVDDTVDKKYISYIFKGNNYRKLISEIAKGTSINNLKREHILDFEFPLPPLPTQQAIVSKIEELFSELHKGIENLKAAQVQLKTYRQAVLKWAFEGKLTNKNIKDGELPKGWKMVQVKDIATTIGGYAFKSGDFNMEGKYQVLRMGNVRPGIIRYLESPVYIDKIDSDVLNRSTLQLNDIIITQTGTRQKRDYGFTAMITKTNLLLNQRIAAIRVNEKYLPKFLLYFTWTDTFKDQFFANETGNVGQGNVGMKAVTETLVPFCSIEEQNKIIQEIENRLSVADKMEENINQSLQQAEALRQSILKKAFEGKLIL